ncbi:hypothetical protein Fmac_016630 [Flemingia macrophylla]|uniref:Protein kinase domain-containing protein n=1 Tax=Flemingia macrophylla TaxID=520843 RepID=A0ABD1MIN1_9FABA
MFVLLHLSTHLQAYTPYEVFTISCGTTGKSFDGQRTWLGDSKKEYLAPQDGTVSANPTTSFHSINQVPYTKARLSRSQFNYSFPVSPGPKFLRLFFYPASYSYFSRSHASFTVQSNQFTLLNDFNASLKADAENTKTILKEYVVNVDSGDRLNLSFTPSQPNSYAFINGIEVLSMPSYLYYTSDRGFKFLGNDTLYSVRSSYALETEYRIKVGGQVISPSSDTGLFRNWAAQDEDYLMTQNTGLQADLSGKMNICVNPDYVAPKELYRTARNMGTNTTFNKISNLTWVFQVDSGFTYMIRLHFCEIDPNITNIGDRVFKIYIASKLAEDHADVMNWSQKQHGLAVQKNYAVFIPNNNNHKKVYLSLQLHPYGDRRDSIFSDAFLNGLEIFKISDRGSNNLAGSNPEPLQTPQNNVPIQKAKSSSGRRTTVINVLAGVVSGVVLISLIVFFVMFSRYKRVTITKPKDYKSKSTTTNNYSLPSHICRRFSLDEIKTATNNFDDVLIIGVGGFGHVYKGYIDGGLTPVAIKRLKPDSQQGKQEFMNEIEKLSQLRHLHLVSLVGYCNDKKEMILVYDFMTHGNLRDHLYNTDNPPLAWKQRLQICIGAARGLHYLHTGAKHMIIHRDVKTTNILLDDKWVAKVSDFGLSRIGPTGISKAHVSTVVKGSFGYLDPEYYKRHRLTEKSDVYSFGVVLFEILCGRPPLIHNAQTEQVSLAHWARQCYQSGIMARIVDPTLKGSIAPECFKKFCDTGVSCLSDDGAQRPSMNDVVWLLEFALQLQESAEERENVSIVIEEDNEGREEVDDYAFCSSSEALSVNVSPSSASGEHSYGGMQVLAWLRSLDQNKLY